MTDVALAQNEINDLYEAGTINDEEYNIMVEANDRLRQSVEELERLHEKEALLGVDKKKKKTVQLSTMAGAAAWSFEAVAKRDQNEEDANKRQRESAAAAASNRIQNKELGGETDGQDARFTIVDDWDVRVQEAHDNLDPIFATRDGYYPVTNPVCSE